MNFFIEQIAICPRDPVNAKILLSAMGAQDWVHDTVSAEGQVYGITGANEAELRFNYDIGCIVKLKGQLEFEILHYTRGPNWMADRPRSVSHLGMHCTSDELGAWKLFFANRGIKIAQEVTTTNHTNPAIAGKRNYRYCIFDTRHILGVDIKFIVRID